VPGNRSDRFARALQSGADAVIVDLEDAVAPEDKDTARRQVSEWLNAQQPVYLRINANGTRWFDEDAQLGKHRGVMGIILPKAERASDISALVSIYKRQIPVFPLIESAAGMLNALEIGKAPFVQRFMFGTLDFCADTGMASDGNELDSFRGQLSLISKVAGILPPIDGVTPSLDDEARLRTDTRNAKRLGFSGKLCIHPKQVEIVTHEFLPSDREKAWAIRVLQAFEIAKGAAVAIDGKMIDRPVVLQARAILASVRSV
jgi:citrate lyase subunit beta / citryl-CoA lyase